MRYALHDQLIAFGDAWSPASEQTESLDWPHVVRLEAVDPDPEHPDRIKQRLTIIITRDAHGALACHGHRERMVRGAESLAEGPDDIIHFKTKDSLYYNITAFFVEAQSGTPKPWLVLNAMQSPAAAGSNEIVAMSCNVGGTGDRFNETERHLHKPFIQRCEHPNDGLVVKYKVAKAGYTRPSNVEPGSYAELRSQLNQKTYALYRNMALAHNATAEAYSVVADPQHTKHVELYAASIVRMLVLAPDMLVLMEGTDGDCLEHFGDVNLHPSTRFMHTAAYARFAHTLVHAFADDFLCFTDWKLQNTGCYRHTNGDVSFKLIDSEDIRTIENDMQVRITYGPNRKTPEFLAEPASGVAMGITAFAMIISVVDALTAGIHHERPLRRLLSDRFHHSQLAARPTPSARPHHHFQMPRAHRRRMRCANCEHGPIEGSAEYINDLAACLEEMVHRRRVQHEQAAAALAYAEQAFSAWDETFGKLKTAPTLSTSTTRTRVPFQDDPGWYISIAEAAKTFYASHADAVRLLEKVAVPTPSEYEIATTHGDEQDDSFLGRWL